MRYRLLATAAALSVGLTACSSSSETAAAPDGTASASATKLTVWVMRDSFSDPVLDRFKTAFQQSHAGVTLDIQIQEWDGIGQKVTSALASNDAPDVIEVGNTQVAEYAASGGVKDLTDKVADLGGDDWIPGLAEPGQDRRQAVRHPVVRRQPGRDLQQGPLRQGRRHHAAEDPGRVAGRHRQAQQGRRPGHLPARPELVHPRRLHLGRGRRPGGQGGRPVEGRAGHARRRWPAMEFYKKLQALGEGPKDSDEAKPPQADVFAKGDVAQLISAPGGAVAIEKANPDAEGQARLLPDPGQDRRQAGRRLHRRLRPDHPGGLPAPGRRPTRWSRRWPGRSSRSTWPRR